MRKTKGGSVSTESQSIEKAVMSYVAAWNERDHRRRESLLSSAVAENVYVAIAGKEVEGRTALEAEIADFHQSFPDARGRLSTFVDIQGRVCRFAAVVEQPDGSKLAEMFDACTCDDSGRITRIITFSGVSIGNLQYPDVFNAMT
jgi:hypothetical protein